MVLVGVVVILFCISMLFFERGFFWYDDYQTQYLPGFQDVARSWSHGEFPLLSPSSWRGGALAAEYQFGVFSVFETACVLLVFGSGLPLPLAAAALSTIHFVVLAAGVFRLAHRRGLTADLAMMVALVGSLNGWIFIWGGTTWFPALASFAWVPWFWWALERAGEARCGGGRRVLPGLFLYLVIAAGWPFSVLMTAVITIWWMARGWCDHRRLVLLWPGVVAWVVGLGLSAPAWLMLTEFNGYSMRSRTPLTLNHHWVVPIDAWFALVSPTQITLWMNFFGQWGGHMSVEMAGGLVPVAILAATAYATGLATFRALTWEWGLCAHFRPGYVAGRGELPLVVPLAAPILAEFGAAGRPLSRLAPRWHADQPRVRLLRRHCRHPSGRWALEPGAMGRRFAVLRLRHFHGLGLRHRARGICSFPRAGEPLSWLGLGRKALCGQFSGSPFLTVRGRPRILLDALRRPR